MGAHLAPLLVGRPIDPSLAAFDIAQMIPLSRNQHLRRQAFLLFLLRPSGQSLYEYQNHSRRASYGSPQRTLNRALRKESSFSTAFDQ